MTDALELRARQLILCVSVSVGVDSAAHICGHYKKKDNRSSG